MDDDRRNSVLREELVAAQALFPATEERRIAYIPGPGDVRGTYSFWRAGEDDPSKAVITYSAMFFDVAKSLGATALVIERANQSGPEFTDNENGFTFRRLRVPSYRGVGAYWREKRAFSLDVIRDIRQFRPHATILGGDFYWPAMPDLKRASGTVVFSMHNMLWQFGDRPSGLRNHVNLAVKRRVIANAVDAAVAVSAEAKRQFDDLAHDRVPSFVALHQIPAGAVGQGASRPDRRRRDPNRILFVGRVEHEKGVFDLLTAFEALKEQFSDLRLVFAGDGRALPELKSAAAACPFSDDVECLGMLNGEGVNAELAKAALLVCPTRRAFVEGLPGVCAEAVSQGVPILASSVVPAKEVYGEACWVFEADSAGDLTEKLGRLLADPALLDDMENAALNVRVALFDRSKSWGSALIRALGAAGRSTPASPP
ncbi:MAG: glycosyltransferase [Pseudomonadota bacterium]